MPQNLFGFDLLYKSIRNDIKSEQDLLVGFAHFVLISNGFKCIGIGESKLVDGTETKTESLPDRWNEAYCIRYLYEGRLYNLKAIEIDDSVMINLLRVDERSSSFIQLNKRSVQSLTGTLEEMIPDCQNIAEQIKSNIIDNLIISKKSKENASQTENVAYRNESETRDLPTGGPSGFGIWHPGNNPRSDLDVGRRDLDPFIDMDPRYLRGPARPLGVGGGGGMLFNPPGPSFPGRGNLGVPPGSIPPGARFDPFRPPDVDRYMPRRPGNRPDNDEFPPPGYDDMFM